MSSSSFTLLPVDVMRRLATFNPSSALSRTYWLAWEALGLRYITYTMNRGTHARMMGLLSCGVTSARERCMSTSTSPRSPISQGPHVATPWRPDAGDSEHWTTSFGYCKCTNNQHHPIQHVRLPGEKFCPQVGAGRIGDMYIALGDRVVSIEVDEDSHAQYNPSSSLEVCFVSGSFCPYTQ